MIVDAVREKDESKILVESKRFSLSTSNFQAPSNSISSVTPRDISLPSPITLSSPTVSRSSSTLATTPWIPNSIINNSNISSVDYIACCGLGHRISRLSDAAMIAHTLQWELRSYWGYCYDQNGEEAVELYRYLFGPPDSEPMGSYGAAEQVQQQHHQNENSKEVDIPRTNHFFRINNEAPGFSKFLRNASAPTCPCDTAAFRLKRQSDQVFYTGLRERFRTRHGDVIDTFRRAYKFNSAAPHRLVMGLHLRIGNGETGDFTEKGRGLNNTELWLSQLVERLWEQRTKWPLPWTVFVATDTESALRTLQDLFATKANEPSTIQIVSLPQIRPRTGVWFGERGDISKRVTKFKCLRTWRNTVADMMLLSYTNVLVAARPSSFTQTLPMSLVLMRVGGNGTGAKESSSDGQSSRLQRRGTFCEASPDASSLYCYTSWQDWCCRGTSTLVHGQAHEFLSSPDDAFEWSIKRRFMQRIKRRPGDGCMPRPPEKKQLCLPHDFLDYRIRYHKLTEKRESDTVGLG